VKKISIAQLYNNADVISCGKLLCKVDLQTTPVLSPVGNKNARLEKHVNTYDDMNSSKMTFR